MTFSAMVFSVALATLGILLLISGLSVLFLFWFSRKLTKENSILRAGFLQLWNTYKILYEKYPHLPELQDILKQATGGQNGGVRMVKKEDLN